MTTETNAERIKRIKEMESLLADGFGEMTEDTHWLIQQAEIAEKLAKLEEAKFRFYNNGFEEDRWVLQEENIRLREALMFYAGAESYQVNVTDQWEPVTPVIQDNGDIALKVLKGESS